MLAFDHIEHRYTWNGRRVQHVTEILPKPEGLLRAKLSDVEYKRALGSSVAATIEQELVGVLDEPALDETLRPWLASAREGFQATGFEPLLVETILYSERYGIAGKLDTAGYFRARLSRRLRDRLAIIDAKCTCGEPSPATALQTALYAILLEENFPHLRVDERYALWLRPGENPTWRLVPYEDPNDRATALSFLRTYRWRQDHGYAADGA